MKSQVGLLNIIISRSLTRSVSVVWSGGIELGFMSE